MQDRHHPAHRRDDKISVQFEGELPDGRKATLIGVTVPPTEGQICNRGEGNRGAEVRG